MGGRLAAAADVCIICSERELTVSHLQSSRQSIRLNPDLEVEKGNESASVRQIATGILVVSIGRVVSLERKDRIPRH